MSNRYFGKTWVCILTLGRRGFMVNYNISLFLFVFLSFSIYFFDLTKFICQKDVLWVLLAKAKLIASNWGGVFKVNHFNTLLLIFYSFPLLFLLFYACYTSLTQTIFTIFLLSQPPWSPAIFTLSSSSSPRFSFTHFPCLLPPYKVGLLWGTKHRRIAHRRLHFF